MTRKLKRPIAFMAAVAMMLTMLMYLPSSIISDIGWGLKASAATTITESKPAKGDGSERNPYLISSREELYWFAKLVNGRLSGVSKNTAACAMLTADITVNTGVLKSDGTLADDTSSFATWTPIGCWGSSLTFYTGTFEGQGHTVSGLYLNNTDTKFASLFGGNKGTIRNVGVVDSYLNAYGGNGGVCGYNYTGGTIQNCYNTSTVSGTKEEIGGVCGYNIGTIRNCYNTGKVSGNNEVGGVCGNNGGTVQNCYSAGTVSGSSKVGGVFGYCHPSGKIINCYYDNEKYDGNVGKYDSEDSIEQLEGVNGTRFASGEICYLLNESSSTNPAWYQNLSGTKDTYPVLNSTHKTVYKAPCTGEYANTYIGHTISGYDSNGFGSCSICGAEGYQSAVKNSSGVYEISNAGQLYWFAALVNGTLTDGTAQKLSANAILTKNIVVNSSVLNTSGELNDGTFKVWTPIGSLRAEYLGTFDGNDKTISGLYLFNETYTDGVGLFGVNRGTIKDLGVVDSYFKELSHVGGVCGYNTGTILNCYNTGTVSGSSNYTGGVCGMNMCGTIEDCYNKGKISGDAATGGVCGLNYTAETNRPTATIKNCYNTGEVSATSIDTGGVCGQNYSGTIEGSYNTGTVNGSSHYIGGVCGQNKQNDSVGIAATIKNCYNTGAVSGTKDNVGGVCGYNNSSSTIKNCYNTGTVNGLNYIGGVCGDNSSGTIEGCHNTGGVSGSNYIGGVCGQNRDNGVITNCYNTGASGGSFRVGGVCGQNVNNGVITNCYSKGTLSSGSGAGVCAYGEYSKFANCYYDNNQYTGSTIGYQVLCTTINVYGKSTKRFNSGEVAYLLSQGSTVENTTYSGSVWGQDLSDENSYPVLNGAKVYQTEPCKAGYSNQQNEHKAHTPVTANNAKAATCTKDGKEADTVCSVCGETLAVGATIPAIGVHISESANNGVPATCTTPGKAADTVCSVCGETLVEGATIPATGVHTAPDTYDNGFGNCTVCNNEVYQPATQNVSGVYEIGNAGQLYWFAEQVNDGNYSINAILTDNITVNTGVLRYDGALNSGSFKDWTPISNYTGTFDGNNKTISGLYFNDTDTDEVGLFGVNRGTIKDLGVVDSYFKGSSSVGGVCGENSGGTILNCYNTGTVSGSYNYTGGVCGINTCGTIEDCYNKGKISGDAYTGGVCGQNYTAGTNRPTATIKNCYNTGEVSATSVDTGGVCGYNYSGTIEGSYNKGTVNGSSQCTGGVCGENKQKDSVGIAATIKNCYNTGSLSGQSFVGGVCGRNYDGTIKNSYNTGSVTGSGNVGGVCVDNYTPESGNTQAIIANCYYLAETETDELDGTTAKSTAQFASGEVAYLLQSGQTADENGIIPEVWGQNLSEENSYPVLNGANVYQTLGCVGYSNTENETKAHTDDDKNGICDLCGAKTAYVVSLCSQTADGAAFSVANLNGGGNIKIGESTTITASAVPGYTFLGWYNGETLLSSDLTFEYTPEADVTLTAKYKANEKMTITIDGGTSYSVSVNGGTASDYSTSTSTSYEVGTKLTVKANGENFAYWQNEAKSVLSRNPEYTFTVVGNMTVTAVYNTKVESKAIVNFISGYDQIINRYQIKASEAFIVPEAPVKTGCDFAGWSINGGETVTENVADAIKAAITAALATETTDDDVINVKAAYTVKVQSVTVTVTNGTGAGTYNVNDVVTVTANDPESGFKFSHWTDGTNILGYSTSYSFFAAKDITVEAVYVEDTVEVEAKGTTEIVDVIKNTTTGKISFVSMSTVPEDCSIVKAGIVATSDAGKASNLTDANADYVRGGASDNNACRYTWTKSNATGVTWYVRAYLVYTDKNGNSHTVYGDVVSEAL